jgi:Ribbon-helix-helix protein, copG family
VTAKKPHLKAPRGRTTVTASGLVRTTVHLTEKEHDFLREKSYRERRSVSEILREVLHEQFPELDSDDD